ncbi:MAG: YceI family protein [Bacteroidales bacterium]|nr:YceI family protein [Bacteroidales bacterium]
MKKKMFFTIILVTVLSGMAISQPAKRLVTEKSQIKFFSSTPAEDIEAVNTTAVGTIDRESGKVVFSVPMQGFEFDKRLMQKHFNNDNFLDTKAFPKAKLTGRITNIEKVDFASDGKYDATVEGKMTLKGVTKPFTAIGTLTINGDKAEVSSVFDITLADYGITFKKGKPSTNIAKTVEVSVNAEYSQE